MAIIYYNFGTPLKCIDYVTPSYLNLRIYFVQTMYNNTALTSVSTYSITNITSPAVVPTITSVTAEAVANPSYVDLTCSDLTHGQTYRVTITEGVLRNSALGPYFYQGLTANYTGVSIAPDIISLVATSPLEMRVVFSKSMNADSTFLDPNSYSFTGGLSVTATTLISSTVISLTTSGQFPILYTLTVPTTFADVWLNLIDDNTATVTGQDSGASVTPGSPPTQPSYRLSDSDREKISGWDDITKPEAEQLQPYIPKEIEIDVKPHPTKRLEETKSLANKVINKISSLEQKIDQKCKRFSVASDQGKGSPLFQAMYRIFGERTTTITYSHYKRAIEYRKQLAKEDTEKLKSM
jgi:hypothetical protein